MAKFKRTVSLKQVKSAIEDIDPGWAQAKAYENLVNTKKVLLWLVEEQERLVKEIAEIKKCMV